MSALNPTRKVGRIAEDLLESRGVRFATVLPGARAPARARRPLAGRARDVPDRALGRHEAAHRDGALDAARPLAADRRRDHVRARRLDAAGRRARRSSSSATAASSRASIVITHDLSILYQIADTILVMYAGRLAEKAPAETIVERAAAPVHAAADRVAARGRRALRRAPAAGHPGPPAVAPRPADRLPLPRTAARSRSSKCVEQPPFVEVAPGAPGRLLGDGAAVMLALDRVSKTYRVGTFGGTELRRRPRRQLRDRAAARSSR